MVPRQTFGAVASAAESIPGGIRARRCIEFLAHLLTFLGGQHFAFVIEELESVPGGGIVAGGDLDATGCVELRDGHSEGRRRSDTNVVHFTTSREQAGE